MVSGHVPVIGIGASAGGVEALETLFKAMPKSIGAAIVIVTHLSREHKSLLPEILARWTKMPVGSAEDGATLRADHVYTLTANTILTVTDGHLKVLPRDGENNLIDVFLVSLAQQVGENAIAVILSGTGSDGAIGVKAIRETNGFTVAQGTDLTAPSYDDMPEAAIATGFIDCVAPVQDIPARIAAFLHSAVQHAAKGDDLAEQAEARQAIYALLRERTGHDFSRYKEKTFVRRVERRMQVHELVDLPAYIDLLRKDPDEADALFRDLLINVTSFFRDAQFFAALEELVIPRLFAERNGRGDIRVWVPGCATGEEAYSLAIMLLEYRTKALAASNSAGRRGGQPGGQPGGQNGSQNEAKLGGNVVGKIQVFATDLDERALSVARAGHYPRPLLKDLAPERIARYFTRHGESYTVTKEVREICMFSAHSLIRDPPFSNIDLISCRNLLIYLTADLQNKVIPLFHYALRPGGYLFLGSSESISQHEALFAPLDKKSRIFQRHNLSARPSIFPLFPERGAPATRAAWTGPTPGAHLAHGSDAIRRLELRLMDRYAPPHVVINADGDVIRYSSRIGAFLEVPPGAPTRNLLQVVRRSLRPALRVALHDAMASGASVTRRNVALDGDMPGVDLTVEPVGDTQDQPLWTVIIAPNGGDDGKPGEPSAGDANGEHTTEDTALAHAEREGLQLRERLQTAIEEYETSVEELKSANEELLSVNEELQSANEELETSKEELQSVNEELHTVNLELSAKVDELDRSNSDLKNLFEATQIATVFLDDAMAIRGFTPAASGIFRLIPSDVGRPLTDIASFIDYGDLMQDVKTVLQHGETVERKVTRDNDQAHYLMRILPYRNSANQSDGAIVTMVDVSYMVEAESQQRLMIGELNHRVKNMLAVLTAMASQLARRSTSYQEFIDGFLARVRGLSRTHEMLAAVGWTEVALKDLLEGELGSFVADRARIVLRGPEVRLPARTANALSMVLFELATNAVKYGALSRGDGRLELDWGYEQIDGRQQLILRWQELDGPPVVPPTKAGYGSEIVKRLVEYELGGAIEIRFDPSGMIARLIIPAAENLLPQPAQPPQPAQS